MTVPKQIVKGLFHWTAIHPAIKIRVSSYYLSAPGVLIDPLLPGRDGVKWLKRHGPPKHIILTNRLHSRHSARLVDEFGCQVWCNASGLSHLAAELHAKGFEDGDRLPGGIRALEIGALCPDESALLIPSVKAAAVADGVVRRAMKGDLCFVPDEILVDDPGDAERVKRELKSAYLRLAKHRFDHLLMAHGDPWLHDGRDALRAWAES